MDILGILGSLLAAGIALALTVTIVGVVGVVLLAWGISTGIKHIVGKIGGNKNLPSGASSKGHASVAEPQVIRDYEYLDVSMGTTSKDVCEAMKEYEGAPYVGEYARAAISDLNMAEFRRKGLLAAIDREFTPQSMTWEKFTSPVGVAVDSILQNCAQLANRVQGFDTAEYSRLMRLKKVGAIGEEGNNAERLKLFDKTIEEMDGLRAANEKLLFELEKLQDELSKLSENDGGSPTDDIADEISKLAEEAKYYS